MRDGVVMGSIHIPRTVLEWRLELGGEWRNRFVTLDKKVVLICNHGYSTQLAAANLYRMGYNAGDVLGGIL